MKRFEDMHPEAPTRPAIDARMSAILADVNAADSAAALVAAFDAFDAARRDFATWASVTYVHFQQDTRSASAKAAREYLDGLKPAVTEHEVAIKRALLEHPHAAALDEVLGAAIVAQWRADMRAFDPAIMDDLATESTLDAEYSALLASAAIEFDGKTLNLPGLLKYMESADRDVRERAARAYWGFFATNAEALDRIYDELTTLRRGMASKLGLADGIELGYLRMHRVDYDRNDVEVFRAEVREQVVPLVAALREAQRERLGVDTLRLWDEPLLELEGNPAPKGDEAWMRERAQRMFDEVSPRMGAFYRMMEARNLLDLDTRAGKAGGGFCTTFENEKVPFIFANFNGTKHDVTVFTHEAGHAFQAWSSLSHRAVDHIWPTSEAAEIHSMGLEFLTWPWMELFFEEDAERFRRVHLMESLSFLPYGVAVDHFQHLTLAQRADGPADRHGYWREMESTYLPWRDAGGIEHVAKGGFWQKQMHIYGAPFYYIDYTLALTVALQFWAWSREDRTAAMDAYHALCERGGTMPFRALVDSVGLRSPFEKGALVDVVAQARAYLGV